MVLGWLQYIQSALQFIVIRGGKSYRFEENFRKLFVAFESIQILFELVRFGCRVLQPRDKPTPLSVYFGLLDPTSNVHLVETIEVVTGFFFRDHLLTI